eukprot:TRINITY_DN12349_c0_g1_i1.p1 TRINITY_DN12349_c0_g1~~TRINITY_DN12349_c0_g1_i1.p1  ORF type:complete len:306 (+),score=66.67 TRINITY_DN12349_c0_g1_i1:1193-2110(+)
MDDTLQGSLTASRQWMLPNREFEGLWESLIFDSAIKSNLLSYLSTCMILGDRRVDPNIVACNRLALFHGEPGTGKTSLCKALAQKVAIRLGGRYPHGVLVEINAHSLFSKWFSESGKLVAKMFDKIRTELVEDDSTFVVILMDEVESLTSSRTAALSGAEPSDSIRVVNAMLTHLDQLKRFPNCITLTTSNLPDAVDAAFLDRADIKQYIGPPSAPACASILASCVRELCARGIIVSDLTPCDEHVAAIAQRCVGLSGRALRKLPFLACQASTAIQLGKTIPIQTFLLLLDAAVTQELTSRSRLK